MVTNYYKCVNFPHSLDHVLQPGVKEACGETKLIIRLCRDGRNGEIDFENKCSQTCKSYQFLIKKLVCPFCGFEKK